jgi:hypothetical protein
MRNMNNVTYQIDFSIKKKQRRQQKSTRASPTKRQPSPPLGIPEAIFCFGHGKAILVQDE